MTSAIFNEVLKTTVSLHVPQILIFKTAFKFKAMFRIVCVHQIITAGFRVWQFSIQPIDDYRYWKDFQTEHHAVTYMADRKYIFSLVVKSEQYFYRFHVYIFALLSKSF